jgi:hypothetical protein
MEPYTGAEEIMTQGRTQRCPRCRLYSPPEALRCDCGYDFATRTVKQSYALQHVLQKEGGAAAVVATSARRSIRAGIGLLALGGVILAITVAAGDAPRLANLPLIMGVVFLVRGLRLRRRQTPGEKLEQELIRRA